MMKIITPALHGGGTTHGRQAGAASITSVELNMAKGIGNTKSRGHPLRQWPELIVYQAGHMEEVLPQPTLPYGAAAGVAKDANTARQ